MRPALEVVIAVCFAMAWGCSAQAPAPAPESERSSSSAVQPSDVAAAAAPQPKSEPEAIRWRDLPIAEGCTLRVAENPAAFDTRLDWKPCEKGPSGCLEMSPRLKSDSLGGSRYIDGAQVGKNVYLIESFSLPGMIAQEVFAPLGEPPFLVVEKPEDAKCSMGVANVSADGVLISVSYDNKRGYASSAYLRVPLRENLGPADLAVRFLREEFPDFTAHAALTVDGRVVVAASGGPLRWFDATVERWRVIPGSEGCWFNGVTGLGDAVSFSCSAIPERLMIARLGEAAKVLRSPPKGGGASGVAIDGRQAVWLEGRGRDKNNYYDRMELLTGEITPALELANTRVIDALPNDVMTQPGFADGVVVVPLRTRERRAGLLLVRLADGEQRQLAPPDPLMYQRVLWVTRDELALRVGPGRMGAGPTTFRRVPLTAIPLASRSIDGGVE